jgi:hypothetical protein
MLLLFRAQEISAGQQDYGQSIYDPFALSGEPLVYYAVFGLIVEPIIALGGQGEAVCHDNKAMQACSCNGGGATHIGPEHRTRRRQGAGKKAKRLFFPIR